MLAATLTQASQSAPLATAEAERLEQLGRIWVYADYFDPYLSGSHAQWDAALIDAIGATRRARNDAEFRTALSRMLSRTGDPGAVITHASPASIQAAHPAVRVENNIAIGDCSGMALAATQGASAADIVAQLSQPAASRGAIIDCRDLEPISFGPLFAIMSAIGAGRTNASLPGGATMTRIWDGFPTERGETSGNYLSGFANLSNGVIDPGAATPMTTPLVFIADESAADFVPFLAALQAAGKAHIVATSAIGDSVSAVEAPGLEVRISRGIFVYPNGAIGFRPDVLASDDDAMRLAMAQLTAPASATPAPTGAIAPDVARNYSGNADNPSLEQRLLALFRLWGTIKYFYPYQALMDRPWDDTLREFIPIFMATDTRAAYEDAVTRLAARMNDSHASVAGRTATFGLPHPGLPGIGVRYVEGRMAITRVLDPSLNGRVAAGDEIVAVDGEPVGHIETRLHPLVAASTPQAMRSGTVRLAFLGPATQPVALQLRGADGRIRTEQLSRSPTIPSDSTPAWRMLEGNVGFIDLPRLAASDSDRALDALINTRALIIDLRGYPQGTAWTLVPRFTSGDAPVIAAQFRRLRWTGHASEGDESWTSFTQAIPQRPDVAHYHHPIYVLINDRAISQAEHTCLFLESAAHVTFVGEPTNGTDGDVTAVNLPGGLSVYFTGHDVRHADGRQLQRIGIRPDVPIAPTLAGLRAGRDEVLDAALTLARRQ